MKEHGICAKCKKSVGCPYADDRITGCKNFVLEPELKLTNEESLRQYNTEQLAEEVYKLVWCSNELFQQMECSGIDTKENDLKIVIEWLKKPHGEVAE